MTVTSFDWEEDANNNRTSYTYDALGNVLSKTDALGNTWSYTYLSGTNRVVTEIDPRGMIKKYEYDVSGNLATETLDFGGTLVNSTNYSYDIRGYKTLVTDALGNSTAFEYDQKGNLIKTTDPLGNVISYTYDIRGNQDSMTDAEGNKTIFSYDIMDHLMNITDPNGNNSSYTYDTNGNRIAKVDANGQATTFVYDVYNRLAKVTNPLGHVTSYIYDSRDNLISIIDVNGNTTTYSYDAVNRLIQEIRPGNVIYQYEYDNVGNRTSIIDPTGTRAEYLYDKLNQVIARQDSLGNQEIYNYDAVGNQTFIERRDGTGQLLFRKVIEFDMLSRPILLTRGMGQNIAFKYDANNNVIEATDSLNHVTVYTYDELNRIINVKDAANGDVLQSYDAISNLLTVSDPRGLITNYSYDNLGRKISLNSPDTGVWLSDYDKNGNLIAYTDNRAISVNNIYDEINRKINTVFPDNSNNHIYYYDQGVNGIGRITGFDDGSGQTRYSYDVRGNKTIVNRTIQGKNYIFNYGYDGADRLSSVNYPSGLSLTYEHDAQGRVNRVMTNAGVILNSISYIPFGQELQWIDGSGVQRSVKYDQDYRITAITVAGIEDLSYNYDASDNITKIDDLENPTLSQVFEYDNIERMTKVVGGYGSIQFSYDPIGNRLIKNNNGQLSQYTYDTNSNRLLDIDGTDAESLIYDPNGNQIADSTYTYIYNNANRLVEVKQGSNTAATYLYNAVGQRVSKLVNTKLTHFLYGTRGKLLGVYDGTTNTTIEEIVYIYDVPVATIRNGNIYFIHTDHLGTPRTVTDSSQNITWRWDNDPFGETMPNEDPDEDGQSFLFNLRFSGQFYDTETDTNYNYYRDYRSSTGRYIQSDPIGISGGINTYTYALNNPMRYKDSKGKAVAVLPWIAVCLADPPCAALLAAGSYLAAKALAEAIIAAGEFIGDVVEDIADTIDEAIGNNTGDCSKSYHRYLQNIVNALCKPNPGNCRAGEPCEVMQEKLAKHTACADARKTINDTCFRGGDRGHQIEYTTRRQQAAICMGMLPTCCISGVTCCGN